MFPIRHTVFINFACAVQDSLNAGFFASIATSPCMDASAAKVVRNTGMQHQPKAHSGAHHRSGSSSFATTVRQSEKLEQSDALIKPDDVTSGSVQGSSGVGMAAKYFTKLLP
jgi:hypothetical protein